jgi:adenine-specific DNA-methyltransferase
MSDRPEALDLKSQDIATEKRTELLRLFPEARTEAGSVDFERLKLALGETVDVGRERYGMTWPGKADCFRTIQCASLGTLRPCPGESVAFDTTENLIIEGDNLEVLKLLQKSYLGKVKMIYIDPPYNTGNDFIYPDNYSESLQTYLAYTGQVDAEGRKFGTNTETDGRFHSKWLSMMYPRLYLARNLLRDDGLFFASIDNTEAGNLRSLLNEIFGEENFLGVVVRATGQTTGQDSGGLGSSFDYVLAYSKTPDVEIAGIPLSDEDVSRFQDEDSRGKYHYWQLRKTGSADRREDRPGMYFRISAPDGSSVYPIGPGGYDSRWRCGPDTYEQLVKDDLIVWKQIPDSAGNSRWWPYVKYYLEGRTKRPSPLWNDIDGSKKATRDLKVLFGEKVFDNPKPVGLISRLAQITPGFTEGIALDFFAGCGTTAHAILELNEQDRGKRRFILVQLPEPTGREDYKTIAEITKERVRRAIKRLDGEEASSLNLEDSNNRDRGFKVFKLAESNLKSWNADAPKDAETLAAQLELHINHVREDRTPDDLLFEIILKSGFPLTTPIEQVTLSGKTVYGVAGGVLLICLDRALTLDLIRAMAQKKPERIVCLEEGFAGNDQLKANAAQIFKAADITGFRTV